MGGKMKFKDRQKNSSMKAKQKIKHSLRKQVGGRTRRVNRGDDDMALLSGRTITELVGDVNEGSAIAIQDTMDARALADLLAKPATISTKSGVEQTKKQLAAHALPTSDPNALPEAPVVPEEEKFFRENEGNQQVSKNFYKKHGQPYVFWENHGFHKPIVDALRTMKFTHPTPIQEESIPFAIAATEKDKKDIVVSAETGSGKTLVFALPVLQHIITSRPETAAPHVRTVGKKNKRDSGSGKKRSKKIDEEPEEEEEEEEVESEEDDVETETAVGSNKHNKDFATKVMHTLIITPTRELALQINDAFKQLTRHCGVTVGCVVGGMAPAKQQRVLNKHPDVLICTPGRIWELVQKNEGCYLGHSISKRLAYVVLDEADKLMQSGRFAELKNILDRVHSEYLPAGEHVDASAPEQFDENGLEPVEGGLTEGRWDEEKQEFVPVERENPVKQQLDGGIVMGAKDRPRPVPMPPAPPRNHRVATFVTSATLSLQTNYERKDIKKKQVITTKKASVMRSVLHELGIKQKNCKMFDLGDAAVVAKINETYLRCPEDSKDLNLYYFLRHYQERTVIFVNAISMLRRLTKLLEILGIKVCGLHASMQQRQRLKYIDKFKKGEKQVLIATDIASRGLDIEGLKYVIHYQVPRSTDAYIHRCGRTARCGGTGLSVMLVNPTEYVSFKKLVASMGRTQPMEVFSVDPQAVHQLHPHLRHALQIDKLQLQIDKKSANQRWVKKAGEEAGVDPDDMIDKELEQENREKLKAIKIMKKQLEVMVRKDVAVGGRGAYRTAAKQLGVQQASEKLRERAQRQALFTKQN